MLCIVSVIFMINGCAAAPQKKQLRIEALDRSFDADVIITGAGGRTVTFEELIADLQTVRIVYVGEIHTDPVHHQIQLRVIRALAEATANLAVGMEMFDFTYQNVLDQWREGRLEEQPFLEKTQWYANWRFDFDLYKPILSYIKERRLGLVGLNIPFYIPSRIRVGGLENQQEAVRQLLPDTIDTSIADHRAYVEDIFNRHRFGGQTNFEYFYQAQCVWEDTMADSIARHLGSAKMVVLAGNGHIIYKFGIPDRAFSRNPASFRTIYLAPVGSTAELAYADYIWITGDKIDPAER
jgi:uncharacterized iron-regulated protein